MVKQGKLYQNHCPKFSVGNIDREHFVDVADIFCGRCMDSVL